MDQATAKLASQIAAIIKRMFNKGISHCHFCQEEHFPKTECFLLKWETRLRTHLKPEMVMDTPFYVYGLVENIDFWFTPFEISYAWGALHYAYMMVFSTRTYFEYWRHLFNFIRVLCVLSQDFDAQRMTYAIISLLEGISWYKNGSPYLTIAVDIEGVVKHMHHVLSIPQKAALECLRIKYSVDYGEDNDDWKDYLHTLSAEYELQRLSLIQVDFE